MKKGFLAYQLNYPKTDEAWQKMKLTHDFVCIKVGQGKNVDSQLLNNLTKAKQFNLHPFLFWYLDGRYDASAQAETCIKALESVDASVMLFVDFEIYGIYKPTHENLNNFFAHFVSKNNRLLGIYTNSDSWINGAGNTTNYSSHPLWLAQYQSDPTKLPTKLFGGWQNWFIWQHKEKDPETGFTAELIQDWNLPTKQIDLLAEVEALKIEFNTILSKLESIRVVLKENVK